MLTLTDFVDEIERAEEQRAAARSVDPAGLAAAAGGVSAAPAQTMDVDGITVTVTQRQPTGLASDDDYEYYSDDMADF